LTNADANWMASLDPKVDVMILQRRYRLTAVKRKPVQKRVITQSKIKYRLTASLKIDRIQWEFFY
jgi:hypothetical protein